jgi:hypothetical protein
MRVSNEHKRTTEARIHIHAPVKGASAIKVSHAVDIQFVQVAQEGGAENGMADLTT